MGLQDLKEEKESWHPEVTPLREFLAHAQDRRWDPFFHHPRYALVNNGLAIRSDNPPNYGRLQDLLLEAARWEQT